MSRVVAGESVPLGDTISPRVGTGRKPSLRQLVVILLFAAIALYAPTLRYGFVWDDVYFVVKNTTIRSWKTWREDFRSGRAYAAMIDPRFFRPARNWSYRLDWQIARLQPAWWHAHNVALHAANTVLVFFLLHAILRMGVCCARPRSHAPLPATLSFIIAMAWSYHPVQTESVCWIKSRDELLFTFFALLALLSAYRGAISFRRGVRRWAFPASAISAALALLCKEMAVSLPIIVAAASWVLPLASRARRRLGVLAAVFAIEVVIYVIIRHRVLGATAMCGYLAGNFLLEMLTMLRAFAHYMVLAIWPKTLVADYSHFEPTRYVFDARWWVALGIISGVLKMTFSIRRSAPLVWWGVVWFFISLLPVSNIVPTMQFLAERFLYFPLIGVAIAFAGGIELGSRHFSTLSLTKRISEPSLTRAFSSWSRSVFLAAVSAVTLTALAGRTALRMGVWRDELSLYAATLRDAPRNGRALINVAMALANRASTPRDIEMAARWLHHLRASKDPVLRNVNAQMLVRAEAAVAMRQGRFAEAAQLWERALQFSQEDVDALIALGICRGLQGHHDQALELFVRAASVDPYAAGLRENIITALQSLGRLREAHDVQQGRLSIDCLATSQPR